MRERKHSTPFGHEYGEGIPVATLAAAPAYIKMSVIRARLSAIDAERVALEAEFSALALTEHGVSVGDVYEDVDLGVWYVVRGARGTTSAYASQNYSIILTCRRLFRTGRRAGRQALSETHIWLTGRYARVGTLQPDGSVLSLDASATGVATAPGSKT